MDYGKAAKAVYEQIGGRDNIISAAHCATRLRLVIADNSKCDKTRLEEIDGVKGVFEASGQLQIIFGTGTVNKVYDEFIRLAGIKEAGTQEVKQAAAQPSECGETGYQDSGRYFCAHHPGHRSQRTSDGCVRGSVQCVAGYGQFRNLHGHSFVQQRGICVPADPDRHQRNEDLWRQHLSGGGDRYDHDPFRTDQCLECGGYERSRNSKGIGMVWTVRGISGRISGTCGSRWSLLYGLCQT